MTTMEEYLDQDRRRNRALTTKEISVVDAWFDVALNVDINKNASPYETFKGCRQWCEFSIKGFWTVTTLNRNNESYRVYRFSDPRDAMLFKLIFGGSVPPKRRLP